MKPTRFIWQNGELKPWSEVTVHAMAHGLHYGSSVFEGLRSYETDRGTAIFRLPEHIDRLFDSCHVYYISIPFSKQELMDACVQVVTENGLTSSYIRPLVYRDVGGLGLVPSADDPIGVMIAAFDWGPLLGEESNRNGIDVCVSSWTRLQSSSNPVKAKAGGHYLTSQLISMEARRNGFADGIAVNSNGTVTEGAGSNLFIVKRGKVFTPSIGCSILDGITRNSVMQLAERIGLDVTEGNIPRESLYTADEIFICGTAIEITPVISVDRLTIGDGQPGPITQLFQKRYKAAITGNDVSFDGWLTICDLHSNASAAKLSSRKCEVSVP